MKYENQKIDDLNKEIKEVDNAIIARTLQRCPKCGNKMHTTYYEVICDTCGYKDKSDRVKLKEAFEKHGRLNIIELSKITGIPHNVVNSYLKDGLLSTTGAISCKLCGSKLVNGMTCPKCTNVYKDSMVSPKEGMYHKDNEMQKQIVDNKSDSKMRFLGRRG